MDRKASERTCNAHSTPKGEPQDQDDEAARMRGQTRRWRDKERIAWPVTRSRHSVVGERVKVPWPRMSTVSTTTRDAFRPGPTQNVTPLGPPARSPTNCLSRHCRNKRSRPGRVVCRQAGFRLAAIDEVDVQPTRTPYESRARGPPARSTGSSPETVMAPCESSTRATTVTRLVTLWRLHALGMARNEHR